MSCFSIPLLFHVRCSAVRVLQFLSKLIQNPSLTIFVKRRIVRNIVLFLKKISLSFYTFFPIFNIQIISENSCKICDQRCFFLSKKKGLTELIKCFFLNQPMRFYSLKNKNNTKESNLVELLSMIISIFKSIL